MSKANGQFIRIMCPNVVCRKIMAVPQTARGKLVQCPQCRKRIRIPLLVQTPTLDDAAANAPSAPPTPIPKSKSA